MSIETSSSSTTTTHSASSTNQPPQEAYLKQYAAPKPQTVAQIRAAGEVKTRLGILWFIGVATMTLIIIGGISSIKDPKTAKDVWVIIGPIIASAVSGTIAYFSGEKQGERK